METRRVIRMKILIIVLMFFVLGSLLIINNNILYMSDSEDVKKFGVLWTNWVDKIFENFKNLTGNIMGLDWRPDVK